MATLLYMIQDWRYEIKLKSFFFFIIVRIYYPLCPRHNAHGTIHLRLSWGSLSGGFRFFREVFLSGFFFFILFFQYLVLICMPTGTLLPYIFTERECLAEHFGHLPTLTFSPSGLKYWKALRNSAM